ncbi:TonB-dependent receptor [Flammeovirga sp. MY04]|uniref:TonB-dependent receptor n=1 Tax=Flammeovirga sp. MY04 TaxID=1191459 RepID=UPI000826AC86|nr:TonB-dependent receptor [Flammeovirga sp. MY04]ANQ52481.2 TonB-dependent receptor [Flammeovirga sp. MY04]
MLRKLFIHLILLFFSSVSIVLGQNKIISGKITSSDQQGLIGATVLQKGTTNGTVTDFNGNFEMEIPEQSTIVVSYTGYITVEFEVGNKTKFSIVLEEDAQQLEEVNVVGFMGVVGKSRRRTESIQNIPESVQALNFEGIKNAGITDLSSFATLVPNMKFNTSQAVGNNFISVRGIPQLRGGDAPVAFVIDGVTVADPSLLNQELYDLALVEVVKGPQGALYGKNAIGGAINIYTQEPTNTMSNKVKVGYANGNAKTGQFVSSGAIVKDKLYYRFSTQYRDSDGLLKNDYLNEFVDFRKDINLRGQLKADLTDRLSVSVAYQHFNLEGGATYYSVNPEGYEFEGNLEPGGVLDPNPKEGNNTIVSDVLGKSSMINHNGNLKVNYRANHFNIQSVTSFNQVDRKTYGDLDFLPYDDFTQNEVTSSTTFNQEIRFDNKNKTSKLDWSFGGFFQTVEEPFYQDGLVRDYDTWEQFNVVAADLTNFTQTLALFGFVDYKITNKLTASVGFRFDIDRFEQDDRLNDVKSDRTNNVFQPKASLAYQANKNILFFANYGKGYRTGGFNPAITQLFDKDFKDELTDNYEIGFKTSAWNERIIFNGSAFYTDFTNQQQFILDLTDFYGGIYNYDKSRVIGFELDTKFRLSKFLDLGFNYGISDSQIIEGGTTGGENGDATDNSVYNGNKTPFVPVNTFGVNLSSSIQISKELRFNGFINLDHTGKTYWHESNLKEHTSDAYKLLNARVSMTYKKFEFEVWGNNLTNQQYYQEFSPGQFVGSPDDVGWRGQPLSVGTALTVRF